MADSIRYSIRIRIVTPDSIRYSIRTLTADSQVPNQAVNATYRKGKGQKYHQ